MTREWAARRRADVLERLRREYGIEPIRSGRRRNVLQLGDRCIRLGFGHGQSTNQRGIKGFPKATTETFYLAVPAPADDDDLVVTVLGDNELVFSADNFLRVAGPPDGDRYLPNLFLDHRDGRYWARVADHDLNYPLDDFVAAWPSARPTEDGARAGAGGRAIAEEELFRDFKPQNAGDYVSHLHGRVLVKTRGHESLVADFGLSAAAMGFSPSTVEYPRDLVLRKAPMKVLVEAKMLYRHNATDAVRAAIGQLFTYRHLLHPRESVCLLALFNEPVGEEYVGLLESLGIASAWRGDRGWGLSTLARGLGLTE